MSSIVESLQQALSPEEQVRRNSQLQLEQEKAKSPDNFSLELSRILASESNIVSVRQLAGIVLKNTLLNLNNDEFLVNFWDRTAENIKEEIRGNTLGTLASDDKNVRYSAAQAVSSVAKLDLARKQWKSIIQILVANAANQNLAFKEASLMTLGYICDGLDPTHLEPSDFDAILTAIAASMTPTETNLNIKLIAFRAFHNSIRFARKNFEVQAEKDYIMLLVFSGCQTADESIRIESFKLLLSIISTYYDYVGSFLQELARVTFQAVRQDCIKAALLALEVWNMLGDIEIERKENPSADHPSRGYILTAANDLLILLLENIQKVQSDDDEWDINKACASVLSILTQIAEDKVMDPVLVYINNNLQKTEWQLKQSALMVIGSVLEGPSNMKIAPLAKTIPLILALLQDQNSYVKKSAAWALSKMAQHQYKLMTQPIYFNQILPSLLRTLTESPKIACHVCWALVNLIEKSAEIKLFKLGIFEHVFSALINSALRQDAFHSEHNLQLAAYSALSILIDKSAEDCIPQIEMHIPSFISLLKQHAGNPANEQIHNSVCEVLSACFSRARSISDEIAKAFLEALTETFNSRNGVFEDGILAIGALAGTLGTRFKEYLPLVGPFVSFTLQRPDAISLCKAGTMLIGDIARALGDESKLFVGDLMLPLIQNLKNDAVSSQVKVQSIESLADVVVNCKESCVPFLTELLTLIQEAANACLSIVKEDENPDLYEYFKSLREAIVEFFENLVQGLAGESEALFGFVPNILNFILSVSGDRYRPRPMIHKCTIGIIGDLSKIYRSRIRELVRNQTVLTYVTRFRTSTNLRIRETANWTILQLNSI